MSCTDMGENSFEVQSIIKQRLWSSHFPEPGLCWAAYCSSPHGLHYLILFIILPLFSSFSHFISVFSPGLFTKHKATQEHHLYVLVLFCGYFCFSFSFLQISFCHLSVLDQIFHLTQWYRQAYIFSSIRRVTWRQGNEQIVKMAAKNIFTSLLRFSL